MHNLGYSKRNIEAYEHGYNTFLKFYSQNNYTYLKEEIALKFLKQTYGLELKLNKIKQILFVKKYNLEISTINKFSRHKII